MTLDHNANCDRIVDLLPDDNHVLDSIHDLLVGAERYEQQKQEARERYEEKQRAKG